MLIAFAKGIIVFFTRLMTQRRQSSSIKSPIAGKLTVDSNQLWEYLSKVERL